ncbi:YggS family pyridoxal phosphate-dependent enzyme [Pectobacterium cacticida]|uniref:Pyridoxal phosphate homeostasis protein n=1 Tax=Pectobacterium cacticida TaxID=69221 RepID=A0ABZ2GF87_9GAMM|nr:YggS family pyridoxal phosphate-dependent enzyme [Pectobacterium cacticida]UYX06055.1 YggS family pyridoxal phosphate-dependent enzyme [Pectobacterium cacticida]
MTTIQQNLQDIRQQIATAAAHCARAPEDIRLLAVSKTKPVSAIEEAIAAGQRAFGENYVQEGVEKIHYFRAHHPDMRLEWHFIGPLQSNKSRLVAENFDWFHTVDRLRIAQRLSEQRPPHLSPLNVLLQINISNEASKSGIKAEELSELAASVAVLPNLRLRGLMAIPAPETDFAQQLAVFRKMAALFQTLSATYPHIDTLSMGMTDDMRAAITAGSTLVRIGTAIFGARDYAANASQ